MQLCGGGLHHNLDFDLSLDLPCRAHDLLSVTERKASLRHLDHQLAIDLIHTDIRFRVQVILL